MTTSAAAHLTDEQVDALGTELDALRAEIVGSLGEADARYIHRVVAVQRGLEAGGRGLLLSPLPPAWLAGTAALTVAKILENMELGHNILHGQWDWMRDPRSTPRRGSGTTRAPTESWKKSHNFEHHTFTNVAGQGPRPRLRDHAGRRRAGVEAGPPAPADLQPAPGGDLRVGRARLRHRVREGAGRHQVGGAGAGRSHAAAGARPAASSPRTTCCSRCCRGRASSPRWPPTPPPTSSATCGHTQ